MKRGKVELGALGIRKDAKNMFGTKGQNLWKRTKFKLMVINEFAGGQGISEEEEEEEETKSNASEVGATSNAGSKSSQPVSRAQLSKQLSKHQFGASRANLFDAQSVIPSAADYHGVSKNEAQKPVVQDKESESSKGKVTRSNTVSMLLELGAEKLENDDDEFGEDTERGAATKHADRNQKQAPNPVVLQRNMSTTHFGMSRTNLFDSQSILPSASDMMGTSETSKELFKSAKPQPTTSKSHGKMQRTNTVSMILELGADKVEQEDDEFGAETLETDFHSPSPGGQPKKYGKMERSNTVSMLLELGTDKVEDDDDEFGADAEESQQTLRSPGPVVLQRNMSRSHFGMSRSNLFDAQSILPSASDMMGVSETDKDMFKKPVPQSTAKKPKTYGKMERTNTVSMLLELGTSKVEDDDDEFGADAEETQQTLRSPGPVVLQRNMSRSHFGMSRSNLFDAQSILPSASDMMGVSETDKDMFKKPVPQPNTSKPKMYGKMERTNTVSMLLELGTDKVEDDDDEFGADAEDQQVVRSPGPVVLQRNMSRSHFGMSRSNLFDAQSILPSASDMMGVSETDKGMFKKPVPQSTAKKPKTYGKMERTNTVSMLLELGTDKVEDDDDEFGADAEETQQTLRSPGPVVLQRNMSRSHFGMSRSNLFDAQSILPSASDMMGVSETDKGMFKKPVPQPNTSKPKAYGKMERTNTVSMLLELGTDKVEDDDEFGADAEETQQTLRSPGPVVLQRNMSRSHFGMSRSNLFDAQSILPSASDMMGVSETDKDMFKKPVPQPNTSKPKMYGKMERTNTVSMLLELGTDKVEDDDEFGADAEETQQTLRSPGPVVLQRNMSRSHFGMSRSNLFDAQSILPSASDMMGVSETDKGMFKKPVPQSTAKKPKTYGKMERTNTVSMLLELGTSKVEDDDDEFGADAEETQQTLRSPGPVVLQRNMSRSHFGMSRSNLFDAQSILPSASDMMGVSETDKGMFKKPVPQSTAKKPKTYGKMERTNTVSMLLELGTDKVEDDDDEFGADAEETQQTLRSPGPVVLQRNMSRSHFGMSRSNLFDAQSILPSASDMMGVSETDKDMFKKPVPQSTAKKPKTYGKMERTNTVSMLLELGTSKVEDDDDEFGADAEETQQTLRSPGPVVLQRNMSRSHFGMSRSNLFEAQSILPSASDMMGVSETDKDMFKKPVPQPNTSKPKAYGKMERTNTVSMLLELGTSKVEDDDDEFGADAEETQQTLRSPGPVVLQRNMSRSHFGMSRSNLFDAQSILPSASDMMGVSETDKDMFKKPVPQSPASKPKAYGKMERTNTVSMLLELGTSKVEDDDDEFGADAEETQQTLRSPGPVVLQRNMSRSHFGMSRSNLFDAQSILPSASDMMGVSETDKDMFKKPVPQSTAKKPKTYGKMERTNTVSMLLELGTDKVEDDDDEFGADAEETQQTLRSPGPVVLQRNMSRSHFGMSRSNLFDAQSILPSASDMMGVSETDKDMFKKPVPQPNTSKPKTYGKMERTNTVSMLLELGTDKVEDDDEFGADAEETQQTLRSPGPVVLQRNMSRSHFGMSRSNLFDAQSILPSASDMMGVSETDKDMFKKPVPQPNTSKPKMYGKMERTNTVSMLLELGTSKVEDDDDEFGADATGTDSGVLSASSGFEDEVKNARTVLEERDDALVEISHSEKDAQEYLKVVKEEVLATGLESGLPALKKASVEIVPSLLPGVTGSRIGGAAPQRAKVVPVFGADSEVVTSLVAREKPKVKAQAQPRAPSSVAPSTKPSPRSKRFVKK